MKFWVANTDFRWFAFLRSRDGVDEVNFWQPNKVKPVELAPGSLWLFKRRVSEGGQIMGGAFFAHYSTITPRLAWDAFGELNGSDSYDGFLRLLRGHALHALDPLVTEIGASILTQPFFLPEPLWIDPPADWSTNLTRGKSYDTGLGEGAVLWEQVQTVLQGKTLAGLGVAAPKAGYGTPGLVAPRLGQGAFRVVVTDAYDRRCAVTGERTLPVLEAAHIKPFAIVQQHEVSNGLLLRSDLHRLFDLGYVTVDPASRILRVSRRIHDEFQNGREYYALAGRELRTPLPGYPVPSAEALEWHADTVFRG